jgi:hypothetical protein
VVFPEYALPEINGPDGHLPAGTAAVMHQRMGFYVAPDGRLLTLGFYSYCVNPLPQKGPNRGQGLGRVVREIYADNTFGPIYFIRYNRHAGWNETNTSYPFHTTSPDAGFVAACDALLKEKLMTLQWWEEDRARDGFYTLDPGKAEPKALSYVHRPDGVVLGVFAASALSLPRVARPPRLWLSRWAGSACAFNASWRLVLLAWRRTNRLSRWSSNRAVTRGQNPCLKVKSSRRIQPKSNPNNRQRGDEARSCRSVCDHRV